MRRDALRYFYGSTSLSFGVRLAGIAVMFSANVLLARAISPSDYGLYAYTNELVALLSIVVGVGFNQIAVRVVPDFVIERDAAALARFTWYGTLLTGVTALLGVPLFYIAWKMDALPHGYDLRLAWLAIALLLAMSLMRLGQETMRGARRIWASQVPEQLFWPFSLLLLAAGILLGLVRVGAAGVLALQIVVFSLSWFLLLLASRRLIRANPNEQRGACQQEVRAWLGMGLPLAISGAFSVFLKRGDILALGTTATAAEIASYAAAVRVAGLTIFGLSAANASTAPLMREYWSAGDRQSLQSCIDRSAAIATLFSFPLVLCFLIMPQLFLGAFGPEYLAGSVPLRLLASGQLVNAMTGPVGPVMIAAGLQRRYLVMTTLSTAGMIVLLVLLIPGYGMVGAAMAAFLSVVLLNSLLAWTVYRKIGLRTIVSPDAIRLILGDINHGIHSFLRAVQNRRRGDA